MICFLIGRLLSQIYYDILHSYLGEGCKKFTITEQKFFIGSYETTPRSTIDDLKETQERNDS